MTERHEQPESGKAPALTASEHEPPSLADRLELATDRFGEWFEEIRAAVPADRGAAEKLLDEIETAVQAVRKLAKIPGQAGLTDLELLAKHMESRGQEGRDKAVRRMHGTEVPIEERRRVYGRQQAIGRNTALSGPRRKTLPSPAVIRHWMKRGDNAQRLVETQRELEAQLWTLPSRRRPAS